MDKQGGGKLAPPNPVLTITDFVVAITVWL